MSSVGGASRGGGSTGGASRGGSAGGASRGGSTGASHGTSSHGTSSHGTSSHGTSSHGTSGGKSTGSKSTGSKSAGAHGKSTGSKSASTHGKSGTHAAHSTHGKSASTKSTHSKKTGHTTKDSFEGKPQNASIQAAVSKLNPKGNWLAKNGQTFCNQFAAAYAHAMGDQTINAKQNANTQIGAIANSPNYHLGTAAEAMKAAAEGKVAFATWSNPTGGHGHIAAVVGETSGKPAIAQAGPKNRNYSFAKVSEGFGPAHPPSYYVHN